MLYAGDIVAVVGLKNTTTGDTLCDEQHPIVLEKIEFAEPVVHVAIEPKTRVQTKSSYTLPYPSSVKKIQPFRSSSTTRQARRSCRAWANCT